MNNDFSILIDFTEYLMQCVCYYIKDDDIIAIGDYYPKLLENTTFNKEYTVCKENQHIYELLIDDNVSFSDLKNDEIWANFSYYVMCSASYNGCYYYEPIYKKRPSNQIV